MCSHLHRFRHLRIIADTDILGVVYFRLYRRCCASVSPSPTDTFGKFTAIAFTMEAPATTNVRHKGATVCLHSSEPQRSRASFVPSLIVGSQTPFHLAPERFNFALPFFFSESHRFVMTHT